MRTTLSVQTWKQMLLSAANNLYNNYREIDKLNVFPVPDGDTGTNMHLTLDNGIKELVKVDSKELSWTNLNDNFGRGLIFGARGNSGVILSQFFKGLHAGLSQTNAAEIELKDFVTAWEYSRDAAYRTVMKPVEGTVLTVISDASAALNDAYTHKKATDIDTAMAILAEAAATSLANTPNLLPILKEVGVVDSGGKGLVVIIDGMLNYLKTGKVLKRKTKLAENKGNNLAMAIEDNFGYCTEVIITLKPEFKTTLKPDNVRFALQEMGGKSIATVNDESYLKIHVHTIFPGQILTFCQRYGDFSKVKIENMNLQAYKHVQEVKPKRELVNKYALVAAVPSAALENYFKKELKINETILTPKVGNPSTASFTKAIVAADAKTVFVLPNNKNAILAAEQAAKIEERSKVCVIKTKNIAEGMVAALNFNPDGSTKHNINTINQAVREVKIGLVAKAHKNTTLNNVKVKASNYIGFIRDKIESQNSEILTVAQEILRHLINKNSEILTIFTGIETNASQLQYLESFIEENFDIEYELIKSDLQIYQFIFLVE